MITPFVKADDESKKQSQSYAVRVQEEEEKEKAELLNIEAESKRQNEMWEWHEEMYKQRLAEKAAQEERERLEQLEIEVMHNNTCYRYIFSMNVVVFLFVLQQSSSKVLPKNMTFFLFGLYRCSFFVNCIYRCILFVLHKQMYIVLVLHLQRKIKEEWEERQKKEKEEEEEKRKKKEKQVTTSLTEIWLKIYILKVFFSSIDSLKLPFCFQLINFLKTYFEELAHIYYTKMPFYRGICVEFDRKTTH